MTVPQTVPGRRADTDDTRDDAVEAAVELAAEDLDARDALDPRHVRKWQGLADIHAAHDSQPRVAHCADDVLDRRIHTVQHAEQQERHHDAQECKNRADAFSPQSRPDEWKVFHAATPSGASVKDPLST